MALLPAEANMLAAQPVVAPLQGQEVIPDDTGNVDLVDQKPIALASIESKFVGLADIGE